MQLEQFLTEQQIPFEPLVHAPAYSAQRRAGLLKISGRIVAKCVLLVSEAGKSLAILPAAYRIDLPLLSRLLCTSVRLATKDEVAKIFSDCEWGVVPPFGTLYGLPVLLDQSIRSEDDLIVEGQTHVQAIRLRCRDFERVEKPRRLPFAKPLVQDTESSS